jgi:hypothetical protein
MPKRFKTIVPFVSPASGYLAAFFAAATDSTALAGSGILAPGITQNYPNGTLEQGWLEPPPRQKSDSSARFEYAQHFAERCIDVCKEHNPEAAGNPLDAGIGKGRLMYVSLDQSGFWIQDPPYRFDAGLAVG